MASVAALGHAKPSELGCRDTRLLTIESLEPRLRRKRLLVRLGHASLQAVCRGTRLTSSDGCRAECE